MNFKIDTKEKFHEITIQENELPANMTDAIADLLTSYLDKEPKNIILSLKPLHTIDKNVAEKIASIQQNFYEHGASFVICGISKDCTQLLDDWELLEIMNVTPTLSEAWDIVQMEEIERELLNDY